MATLKWKAAAISSTTNSTEVNDENILPTSAVTYQLAQDLATLGAGSGTYMYTSLWILQKITSTSGVSVNFSNLAPSGYTYFSASVEIYAASSSSSRLAVPSVIDTARIDINTASQTATVTYSSSTNSSNSDTLYAYMNIVFRKNAFS
jgi:hypothetical protein